MAVLRDSFDGPALEPWTWKVLDTDPAWYSVDGKLNVVPPFDVDGGAGASFLATDIDINFGDILQVTFDPDSYPGDASAVFAAGITASWQNADDLPDPDLGPSLYLQLRLFASTTAGWRASFFTINFGVTGGYTSVDLGDFDPAVPTYRLLINADLIVAQRSADGIDWETLGSADQLRSLDYSAYLVVQFAGFSAPGAHPGLTMRYDDLLFGDPEDPGYYFLGLHPATAGVSGGALAHITPPRHSGDGLALRYAAFDMEAGIVEDGVLTDTPEIGAVLTSVAGIGAYSYDEQRLSPLDVRTGASARWMALPETFIAGVSWSPVEGDGSLLWLTAPGHDPVLDADYVYDNDRGQLHRSAVIFDGSGWMELAADDLSSRAATVVVVAVLGPGLGGEYGVIESASLDPTGGDDSAAGDVDPNAPTGFGLRYNHGTTVVFAGAPVMSYSGVSGPARPTVLALAVDAVAGKLMVVDGERSTRTFSTAGFGAFDIDLVLGRISTAADRRTNAVMDVLEIDYYDRSLTFPELEALVSDLCAAYGVL